MTSYLYERKIRIFDYPRFAAFSCCALAALTLAHRSFVAAMILARSALLIRRLGFVGSALAGTG
jgi:hypothetical protein